MGDAAGPAAGAGQRAANSPAAAGTANRPWPWPDPIHAIGLYWDLARGVWLGAPERQALVERRWRALAAHAIGHSAFYRELYGAAPGWLPRQLQDLPVVSKAMLMGDFDRVSTDPSVNLAAVRGFLAEPWRIGEPFAGSHAVWTSSGTSGEPGIFVHDAQALAVYDALQFARFRGAGAGAQVLPGPMGLPRYALVAATGGHFAGAASVERLRQVMPWMASSMRVFSLMQPLGELVAALNDYRPDILATYPTVATQLAAEEEAGRLRIAPVRLWTGGECLTAGTRARVKRVFGHDLREEYGASECPSIAIGCRAGWLHVNADWVVLEPVDDSGRPVAPGELSHSVLLTNLANRVQPLIRYDLGDAITLQARPCACGNRLPAIRVQGRCDEPLQLTARSGVHVALLPLVLVTVLEEGAELYDFQLVQTGPSALRLHLARAEAAKSGAARAALLGFLDRQGLADVQLEFSGEAPQRGAQGGKLRRVLAATDAAPWWPR